MDQAFEEKIKTIVSAIARAGYDPYAQLTGFLRTQDARFITRTDNARALALELDRSQLKQYVKRMQ